MDVVSEVMLRCIGVGLGIFIGLLLFMVATYLLDKYWNWRLDQKIKRGKK